MKYIVDIPFETDFIAAVRMEHGLPVEMKCKKHETLELYTEPDRKAIEDAQEEAWEFAKKVSIMKSEDKEECWGTAKYNPINFGYSYSEAKARYEAWKKQKDEIRVGCEVHHKERPELKIYVTDMDDNSFGGFALCKVEDVCDYGDRFSECNVHQYKPTGRVLPNIVELLKKMKEG